MESVTIQYYCIGQKIRPLTTCKFQQNQR